MKRLPFLLFGLMLFCILFGCNGNNNQETGVAQQEDDSAMNTGISLAYLSEANKHQAPNELNPADSLLIAEFYKSYIQSEFGNDTAAIQQFIKQEAESLDNCYLIHYKQPINGYDIRMGGLKKRYSYYDEVECYGNMIISKGEKVICDTFFICLPDSVYNRLATHKINELDYIETFDKYYDDTSVPLKDC